MIPITDPMLDEAEASAVREVILSGWVTQGPKVEEFEKVFASHVGARHACATSSGTAALHLALLAAGVGPGSVVLTVSHSFIATANAVRACGAEPVFIDIEPDSFNIDADGLERCLSDDCERRAGALYYKDVERIATPPSPLSFLFDTCDGARTRVGRVSAILPVHQMGMPCDLKSVLALADEFGFPVVEDAACAAGSEISHDRGSSWARIGRPHGDIACFSFHPRKVLTTGDGGMLTTNNPEHDARFRLLRQHGMSVSDRARHLSGRMIIERYVATGFNYRMTDMQAAVGIEQLKKLDRMVEARRSLSEDYARQLALIPWLTAPNAPAYARPNWQSYPVLLGERASGRQLEILQLLLDRGVSARPGIMNAHEEPPYEGQKWHLPNSEEARRRTILLPLHARMGAGEVATVVEALSGFGA